MAKLTLEQSKTLTPEQQARILNMAKMESVEKAQQLAYDLYTSNQKSSAPAASSTSTAPANSSTSSSGSNPYSGYTYGNQSLTPAEIEKWINKAVTGETPVDAIMGNVLQSTDPKLKAYIDAQVAKGKTSSPAPSSPAPTSTGKTYAYNGKTYTQSELDKIAAGTTPDGRELINKHFGTAYARAEPTFSGDANSPESVLANQQKSNNPDIQVDYSGVDSAGQKFKEGYDAYINAQKGVYDIATQRQNQQYGYQTEDLFTQNQRSQQDINTALSKGLQSYDWQAQDAQRSIERNRADYAKYTGQEVQDTARQLALNDTSFARSLTNASRAYGQRGIMQAGVQKASLGESVGQFGESQQYFKTLSQRRLDSASTNMNQAEQDYSTQAGRIGTQKAQFQTASDLQSQRLGQDYSTNSNRLATTKSQYAQDREAGSQAMVAGLQQQGNTLYGQNQLTAVQLAQQQAEQAALDKLYGRTTTNRPNLLKNIY